MTLLRNRISLAEARNTGSFLLKNLDFFKVDDMVFNDAFIKFQKYDMSFTDCTILSLIEFMSIDYLATLDNGFKGLVKTLGI